MEENQNKQEPSFFSNHEIIEFLKNYDSEFFGWLDNVKMKNPGRWLGNELRKARVIKGQAQVKKDANTNQTVRGHYLDKEVIRKRLEGYTL